MFTMLAFTFLQQLLTLSNVIPSLTFIIVVIFRMEKVNISDAKGQAKVVGTVICIGGSILFTFWKEGFLLKAFVDKLLLHINNELRHGHKDNWIKGSALILNSHTAYSAWLILQGVVTKVYPAPLSLNVLICFFASLQSSVLALFFAGNLSLWRLEWDVQLLTIVYCVTHFLAFNVWFLHE
ncbi:hypothetical protein L6164_012439 [Bauhinia variegata]|uniref:Uncharacterized protein n=1 Tax=Bauhinia variegata TaxID=167791 RepID=A0ACB9PA51_BAUVA|nr:hypothetical protein L6164_012439 [Bauhinia variegata]